MRSEIEAAIVAICQKQFDASIAVDLMRPEEQFGDYTTNVALQLSARLHMPPREIAERIAAALRQQLSGIVQTVSIAGPGFLNLALTDAALTKLANSKPGQLLADKTYVVEYSDPNPFKPLHAGHLYTTLVGDTIARLIERAGAHTVRINYGGDVGLHVAKNMWAIIKHLGGELPNKLAAVPAPERASWLGARYVEGNKAYEEDTAAKSGIVALNKRIYQIHVEGDHASLLAKLYWTCRQWSYEYFSALYQQLEVVPFDRYIAESEVTPVGVEVVERQLKYGVYTKSDNAVVFIGESLGLHTRVFINSEGLPTYEAKDVGLSLTKWRDYHFDKSIIITAHEQQQYMQVVIASIKRFAPEPAERTVHLTHGVVKLQGGVKISSRKGNGPSALDILDAARRAGAQTKTHPSEETILAAVKYAFVKNRIGGDIIYDPTESVALEGNSGPYLQYAHARARSILGKAGNVHEPHPDKLLTELEPGERSLLRKISEYAEIVERATQELMPHYICTYLYELAQVFNHFYEHNRVIGAERQLGRLQMVKHYADVLKDGLTLLGIAAPDKM